MSTKILQCSDCGSKPASKVWHDSPAYCATCKGVHELLDTSGEEAIRYVVPRSTAAALMVARHRIAAGCLGKVSLVNAIERRLRKLAKEREGKR